MDRTNSSVWEPRTRSGNVAYGLGAWAFTPALFGRRLAAVVTGRARAVSMRVDRLRFSHAAAWRLDMEPWFSSVVNPTNKVEPVTKRVTVNAGG
jgi:hypothetical protein